MGPSQSTEAAKLQNWLLVPAEAGWECEQRAGQGRGAVGGRVGGWQGCIMSYSDSASDEGPVGGQGDLASRTLNLESKRFYMDLKENARGRFLKVSETFTRGYSRFQVFIP